jgi:hypothetical protein
MVFALWQSEDAVVAEFWLIGTHTGPLKTLKGGIAPTGKAFRVQMCAVFEFAKGTEKIVCERVYLIRVRS